MLNDQGPRKPSSTTDQHLFVGCGCHPALTFDDLERVQEVLAMAPSLPEDEAHALLAEANRLQAKGDATRSDIDELVAWPSTSGTPRDVSD